MNRRMKGGLLITYSDFWLDSVGVAPDKYPLVSCHRRNAKSIPLSHSEARDYWSRRCFGVEFTDEATDYMLHLQSR